MNDIERFQPPRRRGPAGDGKGTTREPANAFGRILRQMREQAGFSQAELECKIGLTHSYISRLESGERRPSREVAALLSDEFDLENEATLMFAAGYLPDWMVKLIEQDLPTEDFAFALDAAIRAVLPRKGKVPA